MAKKISELPVSSPYDGDEKLLMVQDGVTKAGVLSAFTAYLSDELLADSELAALSGSWENTYTTVSANSGSWDYTTTFVQDNSASWGSGGSDVSGLSGNWQNTYTTVSANSASWSEQADLTELQAASGSWDYTTTFVQDNSATWESDLNVVSEFQSSSGVWQSTYTTVSANSAQWAINTVYDDTPVTELQAASGSWDYTTTFVQDNSATWETGGSDVSGLSGNWQNTYTTVSANSGDWQSTYSAVSLSSSNWNSAVTTIGTEKNGWININNTLDSVTDNGNTTANDITVGRIATHNNTINGSGALAIGGLSLSAIDNYAAAIGGLNSLVSGRRACIIGGSGNVASGDDSEVLGGQGSKATAILATVVGGNALSATDSGALAAGGFNNLVNGDYNAVIGGSGSVNNSNYSAIVGATNAVMGAGHNRSVILGGVGLSSFASDTVYVPSLDVNAGFKMPTGASAGYVLTTDANGVGTWQAAAGGGGGSSVVASYVDNAFVVNKPTSSPVIVNVLGLQYQMQSGTSYYVKMFFNHQGGIMSGGSTDEFITLDHTPWSTTPGVEEGFMGMNFVDPTGGGNGAYYASKAFPGETTHASEASTGLANFLGFQPYKGFVGIEGIITAPSTANFTPTLTYTGGGTGTITGSFQGFIMEL